MGRFSADFIGSQPVTVVIDTIVPTRNGLAGTKEGRHAPGPPPRELSITSSREFKGWDGLVGPEITFAKRVQVWPFAGVSSWRNKFRFEDRLILRQSAKSHNLFC